MNLKELFDFNKKEKAPYGSDASAGTFECADCGYTLSMQSVSSLPPCPKYKQSTHTEKAWKIASGQGDAKGDPYPKK